VKSLSTWSRTSAKMNWRRVVSHDWSLRSSTVWDFINDDNQLHCRKKDESSTFAKREKQKDDHPEKSSRTG
jgi:hypothetical protein